MPIAKAGAESVTIHRIWVANSGTTMPSPPEPVMPRKLAKTTPRNTVKTSPKFDDKR